MISKTRHLFQGVKTLQQILKFSYFKDNISQIFQKQSSSQYTIRQINSDQQLFLEYSKQLANPLNDFIEILYDKQDQINPLKIQQQYQLNECELISDVLENRILQLLYSSKMQNINSILLVLDILNFSILCCALNQRVQTAFSKAAQEWLSNYNDSPDISDIGFMIIEAISRIFQSASKNQQIQLDQLEFDIFSFSSELIQKLYKQQNSKNTLDIQISLLYNLNLLRKTQSNHTQSISVQNGMKDFQDQFQNNQFYDFWLDKEDNLEDQDGKSHEIINVQSNCDKLYNYLYDHVFDCILLKNIVDYPSSLISVLKVYPTNKLNEIPSENLIQLISMHIEDKDSIITFVELSTEKNLYNNQMNQKLSFYQSFYNLIQSNYLQQQMQQQQQQQENTSIITQKGLSLMNIVQLFNIMKNAQIVDFQFLKQLEYQICQSNQLQKLKHSEFLKVMHFFGSFPLKVDTLTKNQINFYVSKHFQKMNNQQRISISVCLLKLENQPDAPLYNLVQRPLFCTLENISLITDFIIQFNSAKNKTFQEKIQFYFLVKTFFKDQIKINLHFEEQLNELKEAFKRAGFGKISLFQKQILNDLIYQDQKENPKSQKVKQFVSELFIQDVFSVDYLINDNTIVEVNGPTHYYMISKIPANYSQLYGEKYTEIENIEEDINFSTYSVLENRNTTIKQALLSKIYKYNVKQIPFITYNKYKFLNKHQEFVYEMIFSKSSLSDLKKLL